LKACPLIEPAKLLSLLKEQNKNKLNVKMIYGMIATAVLMIVLGIWGFFYLRALKKVLESEDDIDLSIRPGGLTITKRTSKK